MLKSVVIGVVLAASAITMASAADAPAVARKVLSQQDVLNNQTMATIDVLFPAGSREGRHTHSGPLMIYVLSGVLSLDNEGKPQTDYKAGEVAYRNRQDSRGHQQRQRARACGRGLHRPQGRADHDGCSVKI
jgi:quercetin dioxygenase-like cupin family protein